ncbi:MAG: HAMP domain-containing histidine kinase [Lachnospiraceae bacterium]|nr:HAMP domain-containing histidine kinase [Lachnospiraceae bacterium]
MPFIIAVSVMVVLILFLLIRLIAVKKELRRVTKLMSENKENANINVDFVDGDLQEMIVEVNRLYAEIGRIRFEGKEEEKTIRESISMISHDMRTPLTSIIGYLQIAERSEDKEEVLQNVEIALERAKYLNRLINDFFEISLIESGNVSIKEEKINLSEIICEEILAESPEIDRKGIEPVFEQADSDIFVTADRKMLGRIVQNLTSNAVKYSTGKLEFKIEKSDDKTVLYMISSTDKKIDTDRVFDRFYKEDSSRTGGGAGLGLYICKCFAEQMGGDIAVSQEGEEFEIRLTI